MGTLPWEQPLPNPAPAKRRGEPNIVPRSHGNTHRHRQPAFPSPVPQLSAFLENHPLQFVPQVGFCPALQLCKQIWER